MKKMYSLLVLIFVPGCATFKKIENNYYVVAPVAAIIKEAPQQISGSDAQDSLNGNTAEGKLGLR